MHAQQHLSSEADTGSLPSQPPFEYDVSELFEDSGLADSVTYSAALPDGTSLPDWIMFCAESGGFSGTPSRDDLGMIPVRVTASDSSRSVDEMVAIMVQERDGGIVAIALNNKPRKKKLRRFALDLSERFEALGPAETLSFSATLLNGCELPSWLSFDETSGRFSGTPRSEDVGSLSILVLASSGVDTANELVGIEVEDTEEGPLAQLIPEPPAFEFEVAPASDDPFASLPETAGPPAEQDGSSGPNRSAEQADDSPYFSLDTSAYFNEFYSSKGLLYEAKGADGDPLPEGLTFDEATGRLSGSMADSDCKSIAISIAATDGERVQERKLRIEVDQTIAGVFATVVDQDLPGLAQADDEGSLLEASQSGVFDPTCEISFGLSPDAAPEKDVAAPGFFLAGPNANDGDESSTTTCDHSPETRFLFEIQPDAFRPKKSLNYERHSRTPRRFGAPQQPRQAPPMAARHLDAIRPKASPRHR